MEPATFPEQMHLVLELNKCKLGRKIIKYSHSWMQNT